MKKKSYEERCRADFARLSDAEIRRRYYAFMRAWFHASEVIRNRYPKGKRVNKLLRLMFDLAQVFGAAELSCLRSPSEAERTLIDSFSTAPLEFVSSSFFGPCR